MRGESKSESPDQTHGREGYGRKWLNGNVYPQFGMLSRGEIRKVPIDSWLQAEEMEEELRGRPI